MRRPREAAGAGNAGAMVSLGGEANPVAGPSLARQDVRDLLAALRIERGAAHLHRLGPRAVAECLIEVGGGDMAALLECLGRFQQLDPDMLRLVGGDRFPRRPLLRVPR